MCAPQCLCYQADQGKRKSSNRIPYIWFYLITAATKDSIFAFLFYACYFLLLNEIWMNWTKSAKTWTWIRSPKLPYAQIFSRWFLMSQFIINSMWHAAIIFARPVQSLEDNYTVSCYHFNHNSKDSQEVYYNSAPNLPFHLT